MKLRLASGSYILQSNRAAFNQNEVKPTCLLCGEEDETLEHFLLRCNSLETVRQSILGDLCHVLLRSTGRNFNQLCTEDKLRGLIDCSFLLEKHYKNKARVECISNVDFHCKRLIFALHSTRYQILSKLETRKR